MTTEHKQLRPFTAAHFKQYTDQLVFDDGKRHGFDDWQIEVAKDVFRGADIAREVWLLVPEGNGKTTFIAALALYGCDYAPNPWIPVGAASRDQARILYNQAKAFVQGTGLQARFQCLDGYREIRSIRERPSRRQYGPPGRGIVICPWDPDTNDGTIPYPYAIVDELHRHDDLTLYRLWKGKLRKRGAQILTISTAGEPGTEFEESRDRIRDLASNRTPIRGTGGYRYTGGRLVMHEYKLGDPEKAMDAEAVAAVNPLGSVTAETLAEDLESPTFDIGDWKRLKCNIPARSVHAAITDDEWAMADAEVPEIPAGQRVDVGLDFGWKWDTTAITPLWRGTDYWLLGEAIVVTPPRDGTTLHPDRIKEEFYTLNERNPIDTVACDTSDGQDIVAWLEDELGVNALVVSQGNDQKVEDYKNFMRGLRNGELKHVGDCPQLTRHAMNAIARRLPRGDYRFDRPVSARTAKMQDRRVIDALDASAMVYTTASTKAAAQPFALWG